MTKVLPVNVNIPGYGDEINSLSSRKSIADFDISIISTALNKWDYGYGDIDYSDDTKTLGVEGSRRFTTDTQHWKESIKASLDTGEVVFITLAEKEDLVVVDGSTRTSAKSIQYNSHHGSNYDFLPLALTGLVSAHGDFDAFRKSSDIKSIFLIPENIQDYFSYKVTLDQDSYEVIYENKNRTKMFAGYKKVGKGYAVILPDFNFNLEKLTDYDDNDEAIWTKEALTLGKIFIAYLQKIKKYLMSGEEKTPAPDWVKDEKYKTETEKGVLIKVQNANEKIKKLHDSLDKLAEKLEQETVLKGLLYETGKPLESAVIKALEILGYLAEGYDDGTLELDQVIVSPEKERFIGECEGKDSKAINVTKFRQLNDSLAADFERDEVQEKARGIIFGNPSRLLPPQDREEWFTQKAITGAMRESVALVKTPDLYTIAKHIQDRDDKDFAEKCRKEISKSKGGVVDFPKIPDEVEI